MMSPLRKVNKNKKNATKTQRHEDTQRMRNQYNSLCEFFESLSLSG